MDETCCECEQCAVKPRFWTKRFIIAYTVVWQYFALVVGLLYMGAAMENKEMLVVYTAGVIMVLNYYMKSDVERHPLE